MSKIRRSFTPEDRYSIVQEAIRDGHAETCRKYNGTGHPAIPFVAS
jgi:transposase-like protein